MRQKQLKWKYETFFLKEKCVCKCFCNKITLLKGNCLCKIVKWKEMKNWLYCVNRALIGLNNKQNEENCQIFQI